ncbi:MAG: hypothetical protein JXR91_15795 [Deltaproteobacteria bacterium]|nr:hypothetical protein [Deltaproteobacteria bacterium]
MILKKIFIKYLSFFTILLNISGCTGTQLAGKQFSEDDTSNQNTTGSYDNCVSVGQTAYPLFKPVDIIIAIDNSNSMIDEIKQVQYNMNLFSIDIMERHLDARIILLSSLPGDNNTTLTGEFATGICIAPPLGSSEGCNTSGSSVTDDSNPPVYYHLSTRMPGTKILQWIIDSYGDYENYLRGEADKHFVVVTDSLDEMPSNTFDSSLKGLNSDLFENYTFNGIFSYYSKEDACGMTPVHACCDYSTPSSNEYASLDSYNKLVELTNGAKGDLCSQEFTPVFDTIAGLVVKKAVIDCKWTIPEPPSGMTLDSTLVNVKYWDGISSSRLIGAVENSAECTGVKDGWYYDDKTAPTSVIFCPYTCTEMQDKENSRIDIDFGCTTISAIDLE